MKHYYNISIIFGIFRQSHLTDQETYNFNVIFEEMWNNFLNYVLENFTE